MSEGFPEVAGGASEPGSGEGGPPSEKEREFHEEALPHLDALYGLGLRLTGGDEARAQDLVQETVVRAYRSWETYETGTNCRAWLMTILRNTFVNEFHREKRRPSKVAFEEVEERPIFAELKEEDPEGQYFREVIDDEVVQAVEDLPDEFRVVVVLSDLQGMQYQEIADLLDLPLGTVKSRLYRGRRRLQRKLYDYAVSMGYLR